DLFDRVTIDRLGGHYGRLLAAAVEDPERPTEELPLLSAAERQQLLREWGRVEGGRAAGRAVGRYAAELGLAHPARSAMAGVKREAGPAEGGRLAARLRMVVLDSHLNPVPAGVPGELMIGGSGGAYGNSEPPELTALRFVPDPTGEEPGARLYRTGERARYLADGTLEILDGGQSAQP
ncbi:MAG: AMP-binding protein, partial [Acidobacteriota bacterium]|nr:AMP-binding protein [Acidobacteriota bacterium]